MKNKWYCNRGRRQPAISLRITSLIVFLACILGTTLAFAGDAPQWMHSVVNAPLPAHDEKTNAVLLYEEINVNVISTDKIKTTVRRAYKVLRPDGRDYGEVFVSFRSPGEKISSLHGWCIPARGKDYEVKDKDGAEVSLPKIEGSELISDLRAKAIRIPAPDPGNIIGYEYEREENPLVLEDSWDFQHAVPNRESHFSLQLPAGWEYKTYWLNYPEVKGVQAGSNQWQWAINDVKAVREEEDMPPFDGLRGQMIVSFFPLGGPGQKGYASWQQMGNWYQTLTNGRRDASPDIKKKVAALTANTTTALDKMKALANFVQDDIRYVAIELGIGGYQPHAAAEVFGHLYGDCKDKATLMGSMLHEIGVDSYYVVINSERGSVNAETPAHGAFDHVIIAIKLLEGVSDPSLVAVIQHPKLGRILFFDPTDELTPLGQISGNLQDNYGLLVTPAGGELVALPRQPSAMNSIHRSAKLTLDSQGNLQGQVEETRMGDRAWSERYALRKVANDKDRIKPIENLLAGSL